MTPLADQQLAGVIMWVPAGGVYLVVALWMLVVWIASPTPSARRLDPRSDQSFVVKPGGGSVGRDHDDDEIGEGLPTGYRRR